MGLRDDASESAEFASITAIHRAIGIDPFWRDGFAIQRM
jgi:hypothetical protein